MTSRSTQHRTGRVEGVLRFPSRSAGGAWVRPATSVRTVQKPAYRGDKCVCRSPMARSVRPPEHDPECKMTAETRDQNADRVNRREPCRARRRRVCTVCRTSRSRYNLNYKPKHEHLGLERPLRVPSGYLPEPGGGGVRRCGLGDPHPGRPAAPVRVRPTPRTGARRGRSAPKPEAPERGGGGTFGRLASSR